MKEILILQEKLPHYRIRFFEKLNEKFNITVVHQHTLESQTKFIFNTLEVRNINLLGLNYQILNINLNKYDCIIASHNLRILNNLILINAVPNKLLFWGHGKGSNRWVDFFRKFLLKKSKGLILYGDEVKEKYSNHSHKIFIAPNTIYIQNSKNYSQIAKNSILYVGRLQKRKELDVLINSFARVHKKLPDKTILKILGDGDKVLNDLKNLTHHLEISDKVEFLKGTTNDEELSQHFKQAYCYASPGHVGLGVLHSFAYGVPVITFKNRVHAPEVSNINNNENGLLVDGNELEFGESLLELIRTDAFKKLGNNAYHHYTEKRTIDQMVEGFSEAIECCTEG